MLNLLGGLLDFLQVVYGFIPEDVGFNFDHVAYDAFPKPLLLTEL